jgi:hypothetical protein
MTPSFLSLPAEVRIQTYKYLVANVQDPSSSFKGLLMSNHQIKDELEYELFNRFKEYVEDLQRQFDADSFSLGPVLTIPPTFAQVQCVTITQRLRRPRPSSEAPTSRFGTQETMLDLRSMDYDPRWMHYDPSVYARSPRYSQSVQVLQKLVKQPLKELTLIFPDEFEGREDNDLRWWVDQVFISLIMQGEARVRRIVIQTENMQDMLTDFISHYRHSAYGPIFDPSCARGAYKLTSYAKKQSQGEGGNAGTAPKWCSSLSVRENRKLRIAYQDAQDALYRENHQSDNTGRVVIERVNDPLNKLPTGVIFRPAK